jgi:hypothetical protein
MSMRIAVQFEDVQLIELIMLAGSYYMAGRHRRNSALNMR